MFEYLTKEGKVKKQICTFSIKVVVVYGV